MMTLGKLIEILECQDQKKIMRYGFGEPHSWRGEYDKLAFEPVENVVVADLLESARECVGKTFTGYKGGEYIMDDDTEIHIEYYGNWTDNFQIWHLMLTSMFYNQ